MVFRFRILALSFRVEQTSGEMISLPQFPYLLIDLAFLLPSKNSSALERRRIFLDRTERKGKLWILLQDFFFFLVSSRGCLAPCRKECVRVKRKRKTKLGVERHAKGVTTDGFARMERWSDPTI